MGARGFFGGLFGVVNSTQSNSVPTIQSGIYSLDDQYYSSQEGGWTIPLTGTVTGGSVYPGITIGSDTYNIHKFTHPNSATLVISSPPTAGKITDIDITVVAGGGGGGAYKSAYGGGGGGGGGVRHCQSRTLLDGTYPISVGTGGAGAPPGPGGSEGEEGENSVFNPGDANSFPALSATGGGYGGIAGERGGPGGSGGGKSYPADPGSPPKGNAGGDDPRCTPPAEGYDAMYAPMSRSGGVTYRCGGGGGSGGSLTYPDPTLENAYMKGANGLTIPRLGTPGNPWLPPAAGNVFGGGGGGSSYKNSNGNGDGGAGGGGEAPGSGGATNTGGGGAGQGSPSGTGGDGGEGIVYIRVPSANTSNPG